ncbi:MAG TPA: diaminopimelate epimerase [Candidatus Dormibacteraeota bacterium]|jgi:diaminopimelate epimerase|nr:diaminopimelate epimerase [Candidatus Dormibacteraeota bacterium]
MRFTKMHGLGNDFLVVDDRDPHRVDWAALAPSVCARHTGVGADGILLIQGSDTADLRLRVVNADGSEPEMCGNGVRCAALLAADEGIAGSRVRWETPAGVVTTELLGEGAVRVDMGPPRLDPASVPFDHDGETALDVPIDVDGERLRVSAVGMGNPHCVVVVDGDLDAYPVARVGGALQRHPRFPRSANVEFVQPVTRARVRQRTLERGVGETDACGTGACATAVALSALGLADHALEVELRGGVLTIEWEPGGVVLMTGPATTVFRGELRGG